MNKNQKNQAKPKPGKPAQRNNPPRGLVSYGRNTVAPRVQYLASAPDRIRIRHREYVGDLKSSTTFALQMKVSINPGLEKSFPWLSAIASRYETYKFIELKFEFATSLPSNSAGGIYAAVDYDAADAAPSQKSELANFAEMTKTVVWSNGQLSKSSPANLGKMANSRYLRYGELAPNLDVKTYDVGNFLVYTDACANSGSVLGEVFVEYTVEFQTPQLHTPSPMEESARVVAAQGMSRNGVFGTGQTVVGRLPISISPDLVTFEKVGQYLVDQAITGTGITTTLPTPNGTATYQAKGGPYANAGGLTGMFSYLVNVTQPGQTFGLNYNANATTLTGSETYISPCAYSLPNLI